MTKDFIEPNNTEDKELLEVLKLKGIKALEYEEQTKREYEKKDIDNIAMSEEERFEMEAKSALAELDELDEVLPDLENLSLDDIDFSAISSMMEEEKSLQDAKTLKELQEEGLISSNPPVKYEQSMMPLVNEANKQKDNGTLANLNDLDGLDILTDLASLDELEGLDDLTDLEGLEELDETVSEDNFEGRPLTDGEREELIQREKNINEAIKRYQMRANSVGSKGRQNLTLNILNNLEIKADQDLYAVRSVFDVTTFFSTMRPISTADDFTMDKAEEALTGYTKSIYQHEIIERADMIQQQLDELNSLVMDETDKMIQMNDKERELSNLIIIRERFDNGIAYQAIRDFYFSHVNPAHKELLNEEMRTDEKVNQKNNQSQLAFESREKVIEELQSAEVIATTRNIKRKSGIVTTIHKGVETHNSVSETHFNCGNCKEESKTNSGFVFINDYPISSSDREDAYAILLKENHFTCEHCSALNVLPLTVLEKLDNHARELFESRISSEQRKAGGQDAQLKTRTMLMRLDKLGVIAEGELNTEMLDVKTSEENLDSYTPVRFVERYSKLQNDWITRNNRFRTERKLNTVDNIELKESAYIQYLLSSYNNTMYKPGIGTKLAYSVIDLVTKTMPYQVLRQINQHIKDYKLVLIGMDKYENFIHEVMSPTDKLLKMLDTTEESFKAFQKDVHSNSGIISLDIIEEFSIHGVTPEVDNCQKVLTSIAQRREEVKEHINDLTEQKNMFEYQVYDSNNYKNLTYSDISVIPLSADEFFRLAPSKELAMNFITEVSNNFLVNATVKALHGRLNSKFNVNSKVRSKVATGKSPLEAFRELKMLDTDVVKLKYVYEQIYPVIKGTLSYLRLKDWHGFLSEVKKADLQSIRVLTDKNDSGNVSKLLQQVEELLNFLKGLDTSLVDQYESKYGDRAKVIMNLEGLGWNTDELMDEMNHTDMSLLPSMQNYYKRRGMESLTDWMEDVRNGTMDSPLQAKQYEKDILTVIAFMIPFEDVFRGIHLACENPKSSEVQVSTYLRLYLQTKGIPYHLVNVKESLIASNYNRNSSWLEFKLDINKNNTFITLDDIINSVPTMAPKLKTSKELFNVFESEKIQSYLNEVNPFTNNPDANAEDINLEQMESLIYWLNYQLNEINPDWLEDLTAYQELSKVVDETMDVLQEVKNTVG